MTLAGKFILELRQKQFPVRSLRSMLEQIRDQMTPDELAEATILIAQMEDEAKRDQARLHQLIPKGWLREYLALCQASEAPDTFHLFSALAVLSHLVGRRVWFRLGVRALYAPISVFLVSPAGAARRSSAIRTAVEIGQDAQAEVVQDTMTPEGLLQSLRSAPKAMVVADEAASLLSKSDYMAMMPQLLCTLLDCPKKFQRRLRSESFEINEPTVNALIGCAPEWIITSMPRAALGGGLFSRMLVVYETARKRLIPLPDDEIDGELIGDLSRKLSRNLSGLADQIKGRMMYSDEAKAMFIKFYEENDSAIKGVDERMAVYLSRKPDHVHRLIMSLLVAQGSETLIADEVVLQTALALLAMIEERMHMAYQLAGLDHSGELQARVMRALDKAGGRIGHSELLRRTGLSAKDLEATMKTLDEAGLVATIVSEPRQGRFPRTYERLN